MKHSPRKLLALLLVLCMVLPLYAVPAAATDAESELPIDYRFEEVSESELTRANEALKLSFDAFSPLQWDMKMIGMEEAWKTGLTGKGVRVAVIDSGISATTMDIEMSRLVKGKALGSETGLFASPLVDMEGHGTFVSGIIGATKGNGFSIAGVAPEATLVSIKTPSREAEAVRAAVDELHCDVINMSMGTPYDNAALREAVEYAASKGVIIVASIGNDGNAQLQYPAAYPQVVGVGAVDKNGAACDFSNKNDSIFVTAPGKDVLSLGPTPLLIYRSSGTSFSAPFVTGLAALLKQAHPAMSVEDFQEILKASSRDLGDEGYDTSYGWGLIQAPAAIEAADARFGSAAPAAPVEEETLPLDQQFEDVTLDQVDQNAEKLSFDAFSPLQWDMKMIGMREGWKSGLTGEGVRVGIIDTGVSTRTGDIDSSRLLAGRNLVDETQNTDDTNGHGTFVAGIIGATKGNGVGIAGVAPGVTIVPLKTSTDGKSNTGINAKAIRAAVDEFDCDVINISSGSLKGSPTEYAAIQYAESKGVIIVCSTGNDGSEALHYPGAYEETIGVGFVNMTGQVSSFSHKNESIFVTAPGFGVLSLSCRIPTIARLGAGSSYAAPFVAGLACLLKEQYPQMNRVDFEEILKASSKDLGSAGYDTSYGWGLIQVPQAIEAAKAYFAGEEPSAPETTESNLSLLGKLKDVMQNTWFFKAVQYVTEHSYMKGISEDTFAPQSLVTRAQIAQILFNMEGQPAFTASGKFTDTAKDAWFFNPVMWAERTGLVKGFPDGSFQPNAPVTREQMATILQRYAQWKGLNASADNGAAAQFIDFGSISDYAKGAMQWASALGILNGDGAGHLNPRGSATRAEIAAMLMNFDQRAK